MFNKKYCHQQACVKFYNIQQTKYKKMLAPRGQVIWNETQGAQNVYQEHSWSKEMKEEEKSNKYSIVSRVIRKLGKENTSTHGKKRLEEISSRVTWILSHRSLEHSVRRTWYTTNLRHRQLIDIVMLILCPIQALVDERTCGLTMVLSQISPKISIICLN